MPNIDFSVRNDPPGDVGIRIQAVRTEIQGEIRDIATQAARIGAQTARRLAPRGPVRAGNVGRTIRDSIVEGATTYRPGGVGGGGFYQSGFHASSRIAPHLPFVMEGTRNIIRPARGNVLAIQKEGEDIHFRTWVHGQKAQTAWWDTAQQETSRYVSARLDAIRLPEK